VSALETAPDPRAPWRVTDDQMVLLETIWDTMGNYDDHYWPTWDYVRRTLVRGSPSLDAQALLDTMPTVTLYKQTRGYSLVWTSVAATRQPRPDEWTGLSIAGLAVLADRRPAAGNYATMLARLIRAFSGEKRGLAPDPVTVARTQITLTPLVADIPLGPGDIRLAARATLGVLQREPLHLGALGADPPQLPSDLPRASVNWAPPLAVGILSESLSAFHGVRDVDDYLTRIADQQPVATIQATMPPNLLAQVIDHLGYVLADDPAWRSPRLIAVKSLSAASALKMTVTTEADFHDAMSSLGAVVEQLNAPASPDPQDRSLSKLKHWLTTRLAMQPESLQRAVDAVERIGQAVELRNGRQHGGEKRGARARVQLGLPEVIMDFGQAWDVVRAQVATAFDTIRQEVAQAPPPG